MPTPLTETVQIRVYRTTSDREDPTNGPRDPRQDFYEFKLERARLLAGDLASLQPLPRDAREFMLFMTHGFDPFEHGRDLEPDGPRPALVFARCDGCHQQPGIHSVMSYRQSEMFSECSHEDETGLDAYAKRKRYDWGLLQGIWQTGGVDR